MRKYLNLLQDIKDNGEWKNPAREGMPRTKSIFSRSLRFDLTQGFPVVTIKKLYWKGVVGELLWFLREDTNIKYLVDNNINIWNADAYKHYLRIYDPKSDFPIEEWLKRIKDESYTEIGFKYGECDHIYGYQWRHWGGNTNNPGFDQIQNLIEGIKKNPDSRYHKVTAWNPTDFLQYPENAALPACHTDFQVYIRQGKYLDLDFNCRSQDVFLGTPFNISSYALLTHILADLTGYQAGELIWNGKDIHYYENHQEQVNEALKREPLELPELSRSTEYIIKLSQYKEDNDLNKFLDSLEINDFKLYNYKSYEALKAPLSVGI